ncbi:MAG: hypothetical protein AB2809_15885 [Candidatus Thiodiazotropha sp.]
MRKEDLNPRTIYEFGIADSMSQQAACAALGIMGIQPRSLRRGLVPPGRMYVLVPWNYGASQPSSTCSSVISCLQETARQTRQQLKISNRFLTIYPGVEEAARRSLNWDFGLVVTGTLIELVNECFVFPDPLRPWQVDEISNSALVGELRYLLHQLRHGREVESARRVLGHAVESGLIEAPNTDVAACSVSELREALGQLFTEQSQ